MVNNKKLTTEKVEYRIAELELIEFACEDIVTSSVVVDDVVSDGAGDNLIGGDDKNDIYWW